MKFDLHTKGKLIFDPKNETKKHVKQSSWKKVAIAHIRSDIPQYYAWFIKKRYSIDLSVPLRGAHMTVISDRFDYDILYEVAKKNYNGLVIDIDYTTDVRTDGHHWWVNAKSKQAEEIRIKAGLDPKPYFGFHITIGRAHEKSVDQSLYIHDLIKNFGNEFSL